MPWNDAGGAKQWEALVSIDGDLNRLLAELCDGAVRLGREPDGQLAVHAPSGWLTADRLARLRRHKRGLLAWLAAPPPAADAPSGDAADVLPRIEPDIEQDPAPFEPSDLQAAFLMAEREDVAFHVRPHSYLELDWPGLDPRRFEAALNQALRRQRRNLCVLTPQRQLQPIAVFTPLAVQVHDLRRLPLPGQQRALQDTRRVFSRRTLPLDRWPWFECAISLHGDGQARLHWNNNNFFSDGYGSVKLMDDARRLYDDPATTLPPLALSYRDCLQALRRIEASPLGERSRRYWLQRMPHLPGPPPVPLQPEQARAQRSWLERRETLLPAEAWAAFKQHAAAHALTPTGALFAAFAQVLAHWSGSRHFLLSNMVTQRRPMHPQVSEVLGNFAALYPLEVDWREPGPFSRRAGALQRRMADDLAHTHWSGVKVMQALNQAQNTPGRAPCPFVVGSGLFMPPLPVPYAGALETPQVMLDHQFWELQDGRLWVVWDAIETCFPPGLLDAMQAAHRRLLLQLAQLDEAWHATAFDLLPEAQRARRLAVNDTARPGPSGLLHEGLCRAAARWPSRCAVADPRRELSYAELHAQANRLAHALRHAGVQPGDRVPVLLDKGWEQVVAVHGVLRAGAAYVPIDPAWPTARVTFLLGDVRATHAVSRTALAPGLALPAGMALTCVDGDEVAQCPDGTPPQAESVDTGRQHLAYVIFTSGSTGVPKGVMIDHRGALNTVADINQRFGIGEEDAVFGLSALHFDLSVYDLFGPLSVGATLVLPAPAELLDPAAWLARLAARRVTLWNSVPALMQLLAEAASANAQQLPALRTVMLSGDWIPVSLPAQVRRIAPQARVISLGGATEASIWSIYHAIDAADARRPSIPYGRPLANQRWHVLDEDGQDAPDWVAGHLHIAGTGLALGYWNDPDKTAAAFISHPRSGERLYRTGDLGRYLPDGRIEFLGRSDQQVKIQGLRVEPGEVEQALLAHPAVASAVVLATGGGAGRQLRAFVVAHPGADATAGELQAFLRQRLPPHMVPALVTLLAALPLTGPGKVDRQALERLDGSTAAPAAPAAPVRVAPRNPTEALLARIWTEVLEQPDLGIDDDFFALGGQSFAAVRVLARVAAHTGCRLPLGALLEGRTIARLAERLARQQAWSPLVVLKAEGSGHPLFLVHPAGGNVLCYSALAQRLPGPVHALQAAGLQGEQPPLDTVEAMATLYLQALRQVQPQGPYRLGGWSSGGVIAFEMARQLEAQGEALEPLLLIDSPAPLQHAPVDPHTLANWFVQDLDIGFDAAAVATATAPRHGTDPLAHVLAHAAAQGAALALDTALLRPVHAVFSAVIQAARRYHPTNAAIGAGICVLRASEGAVAEFGDHPAAAREDWGWSAFTRGPVHAAPVRATHYSMMKPLNLDALLQAWTAMQDIQRARRGEAHA